MKPPVINVTHHWMSLFLYRKASGTLLFGSKIVFVVIPPSPNKVLHIWDIQVFGTFSSWLQQDQEPDYAACFLRVGKVYDLEVNMICPKICIYQDGLSADVNCTALLSHSISANLNSLRI